MPHSVEDSKYDKERCHHEKGVIMKITAGNLQEKTEE